MALFKNSLLMDDDIGDVDTDVDELDEEVDELDEDVDDVDEENIDDEDESDAEDVEDDDEQDAGDAKPTKAKPAKAQFTQEQQDAVNGIVQKRLERHEQKLVKDFSAYSGVELDMQEVKDSTRMWGLLKANPELCGAVDKIISEALAKGTAKEPNPAKNQQDAKLAELELREAIVDLKMSDKIFSKNSDKILAWASAEGFDVTDSKTLKLAYMAWQGTQGKVLKAVANTTTQRKQATKQAERHKASVQSAKTGKGGKPVNYKKMSDADVLAAEGMKLFTDD